MSDTPAVMHTLGIDLASDPAKTGYARIAWRGAGARVEEAGVGADDAALLERQRPCAAIGIDSPFGWPVEFTAFVDAFGQPGPGAAASGPTARDAPWGPAIRDRLRFRETDRVVRGITRRWPLSASSDLIAVPMFRCLRLLGAMGVADRSGDGRVFETYPAVALARWGLTDAGYKGRQRLDRLAALADALRARCHWLSMPDAIDDAMRGSDDTFDAIVAAIIARIAWLDGQRPGEVWVDPQTPAQRAAARSEGWIVLPAADALDRLYPSDKAQRG